MRKLMMQPRFAVLLVALFAPTAPGQSSPMVCDPDLLLHTNPKDVDSYRERPGRCEGLYAEQVSLSTGNLLVASLTAGSATPNKWSGQPLTLECRYKESASVHIQAFLLESRYFYRLDAIQQGRAISWNWDTEVVAKYAKPVNVGLVAWTSALIKGQTQRVYLPVANSAVGPQAPFKLVLVAPQAVSEAYLTIAGLAPGEKPLREKAPVGKGSYLKNQRIEIDIPPLPHEGLYRVEVTGRSDIGSVATPAFFIYNSAAK